MALLALVVGFEKLVTKEAALRKATAMVLFAASAVAIMI